MEHEHKEQGDVNRWNKNTRQNFILIDGTRTQGKCYVNRCNTNARNKLMLMDGTRTEDTR